MHASAIFGESRSGTSHVAGVKDLMNRNTPGASTGAMDIRYSITADEVSFGF